MSWDVSIEGPENCNCTCCRVRRAETNCNYTYNVSPMFKEAGLSIRELDGMLGADALPKVTAAISAMLADRAKYEPLNPPNGWGNYEGAIEFLRTIRGMCETAPMGRLHVG